MVEKDLIVSKLEWNSTWASILQMYLLLYLFIKKLRQISECVIEILDSSMLEMWILYSFTQMASLWIHSVYCGSWKLSSRYLSCTCIFGNTPSVSLPWKSAQPHIIH